MDFAHDDRTQEWCKRLGDFMESHIYPAEPVYAQQAAEAARAGDPWHRPAVLAELKAEARRRGLWNLFLANHPEGAGLTNLQYAPLAARDNTYWIGTSPNPAPAYVVFDNDDSGWSPPPANVLTFVDQRHPGYEYVRIFLDNNVYVFRRDGPTGG